MGTTSVGTESWVCITIGSSCAWTCIIFGTITISIIFSLFQRHTIPLLFLGVAVSFFEIFSTIIFPSSECQRDSIVRSFEDITYVEWIIIMILIITNLDRISSLFIRDMNLITGNDAAWRLIETSIFIVAVILVVVFQLCVYVSRTRNACRLYCWLVVFDFSDVCHVGSWAPELYLTRIFISCQILEINVTIITCSILYQ